MDYSQMFPQVVFPLKTIVAGPATTPSWAVELLIKDAMSSLVLV